MFKYVMGNMNIVRREVEDVKKKQREFRATKFGIWVEIHLWIISWLGTAEEKNSELEYTAIETIQIELQEKKVVIKRTHSQWPEKYFKWSNVRVIGIPEKSRGEEQEERIEGTMD